MNHSHLTDILTRIENCIGTSLALDDSLLFQSEAFYWQVKILYTCMYILYEEC